MPNEIRDISSIDKDNFPYIFEKNVTIPLKNSSPGVVRANVYRPKSDKPAPVLVTYGPYGKDIYYGEYVSSPRCSNPTSSSSTFLNLGTLN
jgi:predicted acyl esterase